MVSLTDFYLTPCFLPPSTHPASLKHCFALYRSWLLGSHPESPCVRVLGTRRISCLGRTPLISSESPGHRCEEHGGSGGAGLRGQSSSLAPPGYGTSRCLGGPRVCCCYSVASVQLYLSTEAGRGIPLSARHSQVTGGRLAQPLPSKTPTSHRCWHDSQHWVMPQIGQPRGRAGIALGGSKGREGTGEATMSEG